MSHREFRDLVVVVGFGWFLRLCHLVFDTDSISDTTKTWTRTLVLGESDFRGILVGKNDSLRG